MRFLVDESTGHAVVLHLRNLGHDVVAVAELMPTAPDDQVIALAHREQRILLTNDRDFGEKVFRDGHPHAGIILLRLDDDHAAAKVAVVTALLRDHAYHLAGRFVVATPHTVRIRPQPK